MGYFEITYEQPWAGIDTTKNSQDIDTHSFVTSSGFLIRNGELKSALQVSNLNTVYSGYSDTTNPWFVGSYLDSTGVNRLVVFTSNNWWTPSGTVFASTPHTLGSSLGPVQGIAIQNLLYVLLGGGIYKVDIVGGTSGNLTTFCGGVFLNELSQRLIIGAPIESFIVKPYRIRWSGVNNISQFDPSIDATAGFQDLTDVNDIITGMFMFGTTGYILRQQGISQVLPTSNATAPFEFNHLWRSDLGIGCKFPFTASQYGSFGTFIAGDDIYNLSLDGLEAIGGNAKNAIFTDLALFTSNQGNNGSTRVVGSIIPLLNGASANQLSGDAVPHLTYILAIPNTITQNGLTSTGCILWSYDYADKVWSRLGTEFAFFPSSYFTALGPTNKSVSNIYTYPTTRFGNVVIGCGTGTNPASSSSILFFTELSSNGQAQTITFRTERPKVGRKFTISRVAVEYNKAAGGTMTAALTTDGFPTRSANKTLSAGGSSPNNTVLFDIVTTGERTQLQLNVFDTTVSIVKVTMIGTYGDGDLI